MARRWSALQQSKCVKDMVTLIISLDVTQVDRLGSSMGGLIGMLMASVPGNPIRHMIVNEVGSYVPRAALERVAGYISTAFFRGYVAGWASCT